MMIRKKEQGAALIVSLMLLIILTLYGLSSSNLSIMQVQMTSTSNDAQLALAAAESGVNRAIARIESITKDDQVLAANFFEVDDVALDVTDPDVWADAAITQIQTLEDAGLSNAPAQTARYFVVYLGPITDADGNGTGGFNDAGRWSKRSPQLGDRDIPENDPTGGADENYTVENVLFKIVAMGTGQDVSAMRVVEVFYRRSLQVLKNNGGTGA